MTAKLPAPPLNVFGYWMRAVPSTRPGRARLRRFLIGLALASFSAQVVALSCPLQPDHYFPPWEHPAGAQPRIDAAFRAEAGQNLADFALAAVGAIEPDEIEAALGPRQHLRLAWVRLTQAFRLPPDLSEGQRIQVLIPFALEEGELLIFANRSQPSDWPVWKRWGWQPETLPEAFWSTDAQCARLAFALDDYVGGALLRALEQQVAQAPDPVLVLSVHLPVDGVPLEGQAVRARVDSADGPLQIEVPYGTGRAPNSVRVAVPPGEISIDWPNIEGLRFSCRSPRASCDRFVLVPGAQVQVHANYYPEAEVVAEWIDVDGVRADIVAAVELVRMSAGPQSPDLIGRLQERWRFMPLAEASQRTQTEPDSRIIRMTVLEGSYTAHLLIGTGSDGEEGCHAGPRLQLERKPAEGEAAFAGQVALAPRKNDLQFRLPDAPRLARVDLIALHDEVLAEDEALVFHAVPSCVESGGNRLGIRTREPEAVIYAFPGTRLELNVHCSGCKHFASARASILVESDQQVVLDMSRRR